MERIGKHTYKVGNQTVKMVNDLTVVDHRVIDFIYEVDFNCITSIQRQSGGLLVRTSDLDIKVACTAREAANLELLITNRICRNILKSI